jgi:L-ribulokinase
MPIVAGVDFGTANVRVSIVHSERGRLGHGIGEYPVLRLTSDPDFATQRHADHLRALEQAFHAALSQARLRGDAIEALAIDTTGSTVVMLDEHLQPLDDYYLWCDHRAWREAQDITRTGCEQQLTALEWCGGTYSSEWGFAKVLHWLRSHPTQRARWYTAAEHCDYIVATLCGISRLDEFPRSVCAMGHKWMWHRELGGLPSDAFLKSVDSLLSGVRGRLEGRYLTSDQIAGELSGEWAHRLGLKCGIPIAAGALDAHWDALGAGCRLGDVVNVIGTSTCIMALADSPRLIPGVSGLAHGSIHPNRLGIEAGLSAVGDLFDAIARRANTPLITLSERIQHYSAGQTGLIRLAWDNGDRSILVNPQLRGITVGWRLNHTAADELFAAIEGTAFHTRIILERLQEYGVPIDRVINAGGIPQRNEALNRIYASVLGKPILVPEADTTSLGSAIFAFVVAGAFKTVEEAQQAISPAHRVREPVPRDVRIYQDLFAQFRDLYFAFGKAHDVGRLSENSEHAAEKQPE